MKSFLKTGCLLWLVLAAPAAVALGLGSLRVKSLQGAPLEAEVDLLANVAQVDSTWTVEVLEDGAGTDGLDPELLASIAGVVQKAADGSLLVSFRSTEPLPGPEVAFRLRVATGTDALIVRMSGALLPLPKPQPMAQRPVRARPAASAIVPSLPPETAPEAPSAADVPVASPSPVAEAQPVATPSASPQPESLATEAQPAAGEATTGVGEDRQAVVTAPVAPTGEETVSTSPALPEVASPVGATPPEAAPAAAPEASPALVAKAPPPEDPPAPVLEFDDLPGFTPTQALGIAAGLAVLVVLLVMRRRFAQIVMSRFSPQRDEALKVQVTQKIQAEAARQAKAAAGQSAPGTEAAPTAPRGDADLNAEIDVLLAYAEYAKAEERLQAVLAETPNNVPARLRLAELRYITEDAAGFVALVEEIQAHHRSEVSDEQWQKLTRMGKIVAPEAALFGGPRVVQRDAS